MNEAMPQACPMSLFRLYGWHGVQNSVPRDYQLSMMCAPPKRKRAQKARARNRARFVRRGLVKPSDGRHLHHIDGNNINNASSNLKVMRASSHRRLHQNSYEGWCCNILTA